MSFFGPSRKDLQYEIECLRTSLEFMTSRVRELQDRHYRLLAHLGLREEFRPAGVLFKPERPGP